LTWFSGFGPRWNGFFSSPAQPNQQTAGKILPSVGVALVPVKEATAPNSSSDQNTALMIRNSIKRLDYLLSENSIVGERDPDILVKTKRLRMNSSKYKSN
jgi:hypothetical protein